jgi:uncharacterized protein (TIGR01244 family)
MSEALKIVNFRRLSDRLTTSGQPSEAHLAELCDIGVTHVVNLAPHTHAKALPDEAASVAALGMTYVHIPVDFEKPAEADFERFRATMDALEGATVHVHCAVNARVSAFLFRYRRDVLGVEETPARAEMEQVWRPGGAWAAFIGDARRVGLPHEYARQDYDPDEAEAPALAETTPGAKP